MATSSRKRKRGGSVSVDLSGVETSRKAIPEGTYEVVVNSAELKNSKSGNNMVALEFEVVDGPHKGGKLFENCSLQPQALFKLKSVLMALGLEIPNKAFDLDLGELVGLTCEVEVGHEVYEGKKRARILQYNDPEDKDEEDSNDGEDEDLEERLHDLDKEELKNLALELEIPKKKVLAAKKSQALIDLILESAEEEDILEALEDGSNGDEDDDDEEEERDYSEMSLSELKAECKDRGLKVKKDMDKEDLIEMLEEDDEE